jgi:predicted DNA-binding protein (UPF0278 family)
MELSAVKALHTWSITDAPSFLDPKFINNCREQLERGQKLTEGQTRGLLNIIKAFNIDVQKYGAKKLGRKEELQLMIAKAKGRYEKAQKELLAAEEAYSRYCRGYTERAHNK